ncbi:MAG: hypothetical protein GY751_12615 [Bacteroidetes bacterium]|nr:hypothetical protein [Bacteroidota bacterium]
MGTIFLNCEQVQDRPNGILSQHKSRSLMLDCHDGKRSLALDGKLEKISCVG